MLKLKQTNIDESISIKDMRVGQIGIITEWETFPMYKGYLIKRMSSGLASLNANDYWYESTFKREDVDKIRVKILLNGTELIICNNE